MKTRKRLGIIGGLGPLASSFFYELITRHTLAERDQDHLDIVLFSHASMVDRTEALKSADGAEQLIDTLVQDVRLLREAGAEHIAVPCNTTHVVFDQVEARTAFKMINMIEEAVLEIRSRYPEVHTVGIMATDGTIENHIYQTALEKQGLKALILPSDQQKQVMQVIYEQVKAGKAIDQERIHRIAEQFHASGAQMIILGCTELSVVNQQRPLPAYCIDAMKVLVRHAIERSGGTYVEEP